MSNSPNPMTPADSRDVTRTRARAKKLRVKWIRRVVLVLLGLAAVAAIVVVARPAPLTVDIGRVRKGALRVTVEEEGRTQLVDKMTVAAPLAGTLAPLVLRPGDYIAEGQILAQITPLPPPLLDERSRAEAQSRYSAALASLEQTRALIERARTRAEQTKRELDRSGRLVREGALSTSDRERLETESRAARTELAAAQFQRQVAAHQSEMARVALTRVTTTDDESTPFEIVSPMDGVVLRVFQPGGGVVGPGIALVELGSPLLIEVVVDVLTNDSIEIAPGASVEIDQWGGQRVLRGRVRRVEPAAFTRLSALGVEEQRVNVMIDLDSPREESEKLGDGYRVEVRITVWERADAVIVPAGALFRNKKGAAAFVVDAEGRAHLRDVRTGRTNGIDTEVLGGLVQGDRVILFPGDKVVEGVATAAR